MLADELQQIARFAVGQGSAAIEQQPRPRHVPAENLPFVGIEIFPRQRRLGQNFPSALVIEVAGNRGDHSILAEQLPHRLDVYAFADS